MARSIKPDDKYSEMLLKNIPSEVVGPYLAVSGFMNSTPEAAPGWLKWLVFVLFLAVTPVWMVWGQEVRKWWQVLFASLSFIIWAMTLVGGPFSTIEGYSAFVGGILLLVFTGGVFPALSMLIRKVGGV